MQRVVTEQRGRRDDVDIVETDASGLEALSGEGTFLPVRTPQADAILSHAKPAGGLWIGTRLQVIAAAYNTGLIANAALPKTYENLADPRWKGELGIEADDPDWFATVVTALGKDKGLDLFRRIVTTNGISVRKGHTLLATLVASGEVPFALTTYVYKVDQLKADGAPIDWLALPPAVARVNGIGLAARAPHPYSALLFYDFMLTDGQGILAKREFYPHPRGRSAAPGGARPRSTSMRP